MELNPVVQTELLIYGDKDKYKLTLEGYLDMEKLGIIPRQNFMQANYFMPEMSLFAEIGFVPSTMS